MRTVEADQNTVDRLVWALERGAPFNLGEHFSTGETFAEQQLRFKRTADRAGRGLRPSEAVRVIGRRAARPIQADEAIREDMLE